jgi:hypothetical protein
MAVKNVRDRGAVGNPATDTGIINATIQEAVSEGGGVVYFPVGRYYITAPLIVDGHHVHLRGEGWGSVLQVQGDFDSITINPSAPAQYDNSVEDLHLVEGMKSGGKSIVAQRVGQLVIAGVVLESPFDGFHIHNFNTVKIDRTRVAGPRGTYGCWLTGGGPSDPNGRSDVIDFYDTVFEGVYPPPSSRPDRHGLIIDGAVSTVSAHKVYFIRVEGAALWMRNSFGAMVANPQFATIYGLEADFPRYEGIRIECGQRFYFTDTQIHGSEQRSNIVIFEPVNTVSFQGGFSSGAHLAGMDIFGRQVSVQGMDFLANSGVQSGAWAGIVLEASSRMVAVCGNKCGDPGNVTQSYGIQINSGADQFAVTGNVLFNNSKGGVLTGAGTGRSKVVANNAPDESC